MRSAAKNFSDVVVITKIDQYKELIEELNLCNGGTSLQFRTRMSNEAFGETAIYDATIYNYFNSILKKNIPDKLIIKGNLIQKLRYGEKPPSTWSYL